MMVYGFAMVDNKGKSKYGIRIIINDCLKMSANKSEHDIAR